MIKFFRHIAFLRLKKRINDSKCLLDRLEFYDDNIHNFSEFDDEVHRVAYSFALEFIGCIIVFLMFLAVFVLALLNTYGVLTIQ